MNKQKLEEARQLAMSMTSHAVAFGTIEHTERAGELLAELVKANEALAREAHSWWAALAGATAEVENWRRRAERCVTAWTVVRGGMWDPNGLMDEHMDALRKALRPPTPVGWSDTDWLAHLEQVRQKAEVAYISPSMISNDDIKREFLAAGFTIKPGHDDLKPYVYDAARRVLALAGHGGSTAWRCDCGANLYIDGEGRPRSKAEPWRHVRDEPPKMHARVFVVALDADDDPFVTTAHFNGFDKRGPIFLGAGKVRYTSERWAPMLPLPVA